MQNTERCISRGIKLGLGIEKPLPQGTIFYHIDKGDRRTDQD
jgi:hypothetical protein